MNGGEVSKAKKEVLNADECQFRYDCDNIKTILFLSK